MLNIPLRGSHTTVEETEDHALSEAEVEVRVNSRMAIIIITVAMNITDINIVKATFSQLINIFQLTKLFKVL